MALDCLQLKVIQMLKWSIVGAAYSAPLQHQMLLFLIDHNLTYRMSVPHPHASSPPIRILTTGLFLLLCDSLQYCFLLSLYLCVYCYLLLYYFYHLARICAPSVDR